MDDLDARRDRMVTTQIESRGVTDAAVLAAMRTVPREAFVPLALIDHAFADRPLPIGEGQTISQPFVVALMVEALALRGDGTERVLEVGGGSGYAAAVIGAIAAEVWTIERHGPLADQARAALEAAGIGNVHVIQGDGTRGCPDAAPFDAIVVAAGGPSVPETLRRQLRVGGRMVIPVGPAQRLQTLLRITRTGENTFEQEEMGDVAFVPLIGQEGWARDDQP